MMTTNKTESVELESPVALITVTFENGTTESFNKGIAIGIIEEKKGNKVTGATVNAQFLESGMQEIDMAIMSLNNAKKSALESAGLPPEFADLLEMMDSFKR